MSSIESLANCDIAKAIRNGTLSTYEKTNPHYGFTFWVIEDENGFIEIAGDKAELDNRLDAVRAAMETIGKE